MIRTPRHAWIAAGALLTGAFALAGCGNERTAEVETGAAEAEVSTTLPESQVSDQQLENAAVGAAAMAETPQAAASVVITPDTDAQTDPAAAGTPPPQ